MFRVYSGTLTNGARVYYNNNICMWIRRLLTWRYIVRYYNLRDGLSWQITIYPITAEYNNRCRSSDSLVYNSESLRNCPRIANRCFSLNTAWGKMEFIRPARFVGLLLPMPVIEMSTTCVLIVQAFRRRHRRSPSLIRNIYFR